MVIVASIYHVPDFDRWKTAFDRALARGPAPGLLGYRIFQAADDVNEIMVELELDSVASAEALLAGADERWLSKSGLEVYPPAFVGTAVARARFD